MAVPVTDDDERLRDEVVDWLRDHLPADWVEGIEHDDPDRARRARTGFDQQRFLQEIGEAGWASRRGPRPAAARASTPHRLASSRR